MSESKEEETVTAQVAALVAARDVAALQVLAAGADKTLAKAARRGLHLLRTKGEKAEAPRVPAMGTVMAIGERPEAWVSVPDGRGERLVGVLVPAPSGGFDVVSAAISDESGIVEAYAGRGPRKAARDARRGFEESGRLTADVEIALAAALLEQAYQLTMSLKRSPPGDYAAARRLLARFLAPGAAEAAHPALARVAAADELDRETAAGLLDLPDLYSWVPSRDVLQQLSLRFDEIATSTILVDDRQRQQARGDAIDRAIAATFDPAGRARWQRRLLDAALTYAAAGHEEEGAQMRAQSDRLGAPTLDPLLDPFCRAMVEKLVPADGAVATPAAPEEKQSGGIIIP